MSRDGDLCISCVEREKKTIEKVRGITGTTIKGMLPSFLNGRVIEPIPFWSRLYDGAWFRLKVDSGCTISEDIMAKAKKAAAVAYEDVTVVEPQPMPTGRKTKTKKAVVPVAAAVAVPIAAQIAAPIAAQIAAQIAAPIVKAKKRIIKPVGSLPVAVLRVEPTELPVESIREIHVRRTEVDGRALYLASKKEKLYDLKFKYIGRLKDGKIVAFPDSDDDV
jgi:hypothetical protein